MMHRFGACALAVGIWVNACHAQNNVDIPIDQATSLATRALLAGDTALALQIAKAVLRSRPDDRASLIIVAAAASRLGDPARGRAAGARAWALSETPEQRYEAARLTALAASLEERFTTASFWLRLALISAPNAQEEDRTRNDARIVARRNSLTTQFSLSFAPSNNVNTGAESEISTAPGNPDGLLSEDAQALAGWRASLGIGTTYRLHENTDSRTTAGLNLRATQVKITDETIVPDEAFSNESYEIQLRHERRLGEGLFGIAATYGQFAYRDLDLDTATTETESYSVARLQTDYRMTVGPQTSLQLSASHEVISYESVGIGEVNRSRAGTNLGHRLSSGDQISLGFDLVSSVGDNANYTADEYGLRVGYRWAEPIGDVTVALSGGLRTADFPEYSLLNPVPGGRQDKTVFANVDLGFPQAEFAGFIPGVRIDALRTDSNVSRFERTTLGASLTISSSF